MGKSPFAFDDASDNPWIVWVQHVPVIELIEKQTDSRRSQQDMQPVAAPPLSPLSAQTAGIERKQYTAVLNRMNRAAGRVGNFSQWESVHT